jgi:DNA-binding CsgD family transcriptional regulator
VLDVAGTDRLKGSRSGALRRLSSQVLVGRERELDVLMDAVTHPPVVVMVAGEAGVGKTRLVEELLARPELRGRQCLVGHCHQVGEPFPLGPVLDAMRTAAPAAALNPVTGALRPLLPELAGVLPETPEPLGDLRAERHRLFRALRELVHALRAPVLVLEDLHWADHATLELLRFLAPQLPPGAALVCTYRGDEVGEASRLVGLAARLPGGIASVHVEVGLLDRGDVGRLAGGILDTEGVSAEFAEYLFECSEGLPFAVEETVRLLQDRRDLVHRRGLWVRHELEQIGVPIAFRDSILERLGRLRTGARRMVQASAVVGVPARDEVLVTVADLPHGRAGPALARALSSGLLVETEAGYGFRHVLARQAVEEAIPSPIQRRLHLRAARALEAGRPRPLARLAHHYRAAGNPKMWMRYAEAAADRAMSLQDDATAYRFLKEAVSVAELAPRTRRRLAVKLATHALYCLEHEEAIGILQPLIADEALPAGVRGELRLCLARLLGQAGRPDLRAREIVSALDALRRRPALAARAMADLALPWVTDHGIEEHIAWADEAVGRLDGSRDRVARIAALTGRAVALVSSGQRGGSEAVDAVPKPGADAEEMKQAVRSFINLSDALMHAGYYRRAEALVADGLQIAREANFVRGATHLKMNRLQLDWAVGSWEGLAERSRAAVETWEDWPLVRADAAVVLALLRIARGEFRAALRLLEPLACEFPGELHDRLWATGGLARINLAQGNAEAALAAVAHDLELLERKGLWGWATEIAPVTVEALLARASAADAAALTRRYAQGLRGRDAPAASAALAICRGLVAEGDADRERAARFYLASERAWRTLPRPYEAARARERAGRCLLDQRPERGRELLVAAMDAFRVLGAAWDAARIRRTLRVQGVIPPNRRGRKGYGDQLSPRELEVARLAGSGATNREIAAQLYVSIKAVEKHLTSAMGKLGVTSRTELAMRLGPARPQLLAHP